MDLARDGNLIEAGLWFVLGVVVLGRALLRKEDRGCWLALAITLVLFDASDVVESRTGAWWKPWWLFAWKALCVLALVVLFASLFRRARGAGPQR